MLNCELMCKNWFRYRLVCFAAAILLFCTFSYSAQTDSVANLGIGISKNEKVDSIINKNFTLDELKILLSAYNFYDNIRVADQNERVIQHLLSQCEQQNYLIGVAKCKNLLGVIYRDKAEYAMSIVLHEEALNVSGSDTIMRIFALNNLGVVYRRLDKPRVALDYHLQALRLSESLTSNPTVKARSICVAQNSIGNINLSLNQPIQALEMFNRSLNQERLLKNDLGIAINLGNIGIAYEQLGKLDTALFYYKQSLFYNERINSATGKSICYNNIGNIFLLKEDPKKAYDYFKLGLQFAENTQDDYYIAQSHANLGKVYLSLKNWNLAFHELKLFNTVAIDINSSSMIQDSYKLLSTYYEKTDDYSKALENYKIGVRFNDSLLNEKNSRYLNELQVVYESKKRQQQIDLLTAENLIKNQRTAISIGTLILLLVIASSLVYYQRKKNAYTSGELKQRLLRSQMNPHFIFNALGSIQNYMYNNDPRKAASYLGRFSSLARSVLNNSNEDFITLCEELEVLTDYIELEKMRLNNKFEYEIIVDENVDCEFTLIPPMLLQPFIENAIKHGFQNCDSGGKLTLKFSDADNQLYVSIIDNGVGIKASLANKESTCHKSMAMTIFEERRRLMQRKLKKSITFAVTDLSETNNSLNGTMIEFYFPIIN